MHAPVTLQVFSTSIVALAAIGLSAVDASWNCEDEVLSRPIQYLRCGTSNPSRPLCSDPAAVDGHGLYSLDLSTGNYVAAFTISTAELGGMNACGINPVDSFAYCAARVESSSNEASKVRLIRFGSTHADPNDASFEFVAVLPVPADTDELGGQDANVQLVNTGTFSRDGNYYVSGPWAKYPTCLRSMTDGPSDRLLSWCLDCLLISLTFAWP